MSIPLKLKSITTLPLQLLTVLYKALTEPSLLTDRLLQEKHILCREQLVKQLHKIQVSFQEWSNMFLIPLQDLKKL